MKNPIDAIKSYKAGQRTSFAAPPRAQEYREIGFDADSGKSILQGRDNSEINSEPITNGYRALGQAVSVHRSGSVAQHNAMPKPKDDAKRVGELETVKTIKFLFKNNGAYFVGGHQSNPIKVGEISGSGFQPIVIENLGGKNFVLIGYKGLNQQDTVIQRWRNRSLVSEKIIENGRSTASRFGLSLGVAAGELEILPEFSEYDNVLGIDRNSENLKVRFVYNGKTSSNLSIEPIFEANYFAPTETNKKQYYWDDRLRGLPLSGRFVTGEEPIPTPNRFGTITRNAAIAQNQGLVLPERRFLADVKQNSETWQYIGNVEIGDPLLIVSESHDLTNALIFDAKLNTSLCVRSVYSLESETKVGSSRSVMSVFSNLILVGSSGIDTVISPSFDVRSLDFFEISPLDQAISIGNGVTIAQPQPIRPNTFRGARHSLHFLNFAILQNSKLTIVDPIKNELNIWELSSNPTKTIKKADYYPLPKNAQILGAQWHK
jgi:hypothetical protein